MSRLPVDYDEAQHGMLVGKAARLADWAFQREQEDFAAVVNRLRVKKWAKENPEARKAIARRYARKNRARQVKQQKELRHARHRAEGKVYACPGCGARFCRLPGTARGIPPKWCMTACYTRTKYRAKAAASAPEKLRACGLCGVRGHNRRGCPTRLAETA